jgi:hypothetical protein
MSPVAAAISRQQRGETDVRYWLMYQPPFGEITCPVMNFASSLAR